MDADPFIFTDFLACDIGIYLMPYDSCTIYFLKELLGGRKSMIKTT